jgi:DNA repair exonuclease SbcCD nuclease subunit
MRIAVTADLHLRESNPERLENLQVLLRQLQSRRIRSLIIAGDLFDGFDNSYAGFDALAGRFPDFHMFVIPGNHDPDLGQQHFASGNVQVFSKPTLKPIDQRPFLFLPYREGSTIGETISGLPDAERLRTLPWILVSHGDFTAPRPKDSGDERGYFPLTREDLARFKPARVLLGHIHAPNSTTDAVLNPGSPYPVTSDEYGQRRVLILETKSGAVAGLPLSHPPVQVRVELFLIPDGREGEQIRSQLQSALAEQGEPEKLVVQVVLKGYSASRRRAREFVEELLRKEKIYCAGIDLESLRVNDQENLATLAGAVRKRVKQLELKYEAAEELRRAVLEKALDIVYGA